MIFMLITAISLFITTNLDDIFILILLFFQKDSEEKQSRNDLCKIVLGQYLGFGFILGLSLLGSFGATFISIEWTGILGLLPIYLGVRMLVRQKQVNLADSDSVFKVKISVISIAAFTMANGGDNIGIYMPCFLTLQPIQVIFTIVTFFVLLAIWCWLGYKLAQLNQIAKTLEKYGKKIVPFVFIGLGVYILIKSNFLFF
ncbi:cadmium resistance transporter [Enterococcus sp. 5H]|uniref:cadmium resistance transporter n=1 Tax=Enterococcus sp. 5H TaxID=1229490 RepID=UPI002303CD6B|nr:cadmium resistance transporter [Enterococcus sp. 5H]MDA9470064.1 putative cadmium resistance transporter [Enterococcus sp. 5H]